MMEPEILLFDFLQPLPLLKEAFFVRSVFDFRQVAIVPKNFLEIFSAKLNFSLRSDIIVSKTGDEIVTRIINGVKVSE